MDECNLTLVPMDSNMKFSKNIEEEDTDITEYQSLVGRLRYLLKKIPDRIQLALQAGICKLQKRSHMEEIKEIFRYVKGTLSYGIRYTHRKPLELVGYNDSSHNIDHDVGRSTIGHVFYLKRSSLTWCSQK